MRKIRDVLRLKFEARLSHERIAVSLGISKDVVAKSVSLAAAAAAGLNWATHSDVERHRPEASRRTRPIGPADPLRAARLRPCQSRTAAQGHDAHAAVGGVRRGPPRSADLRPQPVLRIISALRTAPEALDAPDSPRGEKLLWTTPALPSSSVTQAEHTSSWPPRAPPVTPSPGRRRERPWPTGSRAVYSP